MRILRVYHAGRDPAQHAREQALVASHLDVVLAAPSSWPVPEGAEAEASLELEVHQLPVRRPGDVNRHAYRNDEMLRGLIETVHPDLLDVHEEPFSVAARQWLAAAPPELPVVMYTAQNIDKRFPPPFAQYERAAHRRVAALYPCTAQAASVARGKGFSGLIDVIPLGFDDALFAPGDQSVDDGVVVLALFGRLVPEKGVVDAVRILAVVNHSRPARLVIHGVGPEEESARSVASALGVADRLELSPWLAAPELASVYRRAHVVLVPSRATMTWVEQFGRVIVEAQASGSVVAGYASGSIPEVAGEAAVLTEVGSVAKLAERIVHLLADHADFARRREQGIALSKGRSWAHVARRQTELYERVLRGERIPLSLARSPRRRRAAARAEFGASASTTAGPRPFALPLLRRGGIAVTALGGALDLVAEAAARLHRG